MSSERRFEVASIIPKLMCGGH